MTGDGAMFFDSLQPESLQVNEPHVIPWKGRLEELEERVARLEEVVKGLATGA